MAVVQPPGSPEFDSYRRRVSDSIEAKTILTQRGRDNRLFELERVPNLRPASDSYPLLLRPHGAHLQKWGTPSPL